MAATGGASGEDGSGEATCLVACPGAPLLRQAGGGAVVNLETTGWLGQARRGSVRGSAVLSGRRHFRDSHAARTLCTLSLCGAVLLWACLGFVGQGI